jgi:hypothetical protein
MYLIRICKFGRKRNMKNTLIKKGLVVAIIVLFIGISIASGITFKVDLSKNLQIAATDKDLVEVPIQIGDVN